MRLSGTKVGAVHQYRGFGDVLYDKGATRPTLDLNFANNDSLADSITGKTLPTFTRASSGTYVDGDGVIRTSPVNLLTRSEEFDNSNWVKLGVTFTPNAVSSPDGTITTEKPDVTWDYVGIYDNSNSGWLSGYPQAFPFTVTNQWVRQSLQFTTPAGCTLIRYYPGRLGAGGASYIYQNVSVTAETTYTASAYYKLDTDGTVLIWGAQLQEGTTATDYIPTTSTISGAPRFDHDPDTGESLGLLIEEARTNTLEYSEAFDNAWWAKANSVITANAVTSPAGDTTADQITPNAVTSTFSVYKQLSFVSGNTYTQSIFAKANTYSVIGLEEQTNSGGAKITSFDLSSGTIGVVNAAHTASIEDFGNGWYRCSITYSCTETASNFIAARVLETINTGLGNWTPDGTSNLYFWGFQLEQGSFPTSYIPTEGSTVTRAADVAEITGADFAKTNLLQYSERFDQSAWNKVQGDVTPNAETAPDGTATADLFVPNATNNFHFVNQSATTTASTTYRHSVYAKPFGYNFLLINFAGSGPVIDLSSGTVVGNFGGSTRNAIVENAGNGWYRCSIEVTAVSASSVIDHNVLPTSSVASYTGDGTSGVYFWGAQLEEGSVLTDYTPSVESFDSRASSATYVDDTTGLITTAAVDEARYENGELLLEEARTNSATYSEVFNQGFWAGSNTSVSNTAVLAPDGIGTAQKLTVNSSNISSRILNSGFNAAAGETWTLSGWIKTDQGASTNMRVTIALGSVAIYANTTCDLTTEWQRFSVTGTVPADGVERANPLIYVHELGASNAVAGDYIYLWGVQLEQGSYPTSYIPTSGSTVTRAADVSTSALGVDSFYNQTEGTVFAQTSSVTNQAAIPSRTVFTIVEDNNNFHGYEYRTADFVDFTINSRIGAVRQYSPVDVGTPNYVNDKTAISYSSTGGTFVDKGTTSSSSVADLSVIASVKLYLGASPTGFLLNGHIKRLAYFNTRLPDATLQNITT